jgi:hypothetical protein
VRTGYESLDGVGVVVEKLDVEVNAGDGSVTLFGDLILLRLSEWFAFFFLRDERDSDEQ